MYWCVFTWQRVWSLGRSWAIWPQHSGRPPPQTARSSFPCERSTPTPVVSGTLRKHPTHKHTVTNRRSETWVLSDLSRTLAEFGLHNFHLLESFQHATQVSDAVLKRNLLVLAGMSILQNIPNIDLQLRLRLLFPVKVRDVINKGGDGVWF